PPRRADRSRQHARALGRADLPPELREREGAARVQRFSAHGRARGSGDAVDRRRADAAQEARLRSRSDRASPSAAAAAPPPLKPQPNAEPIGPPERREEDRMRAADRTARERRI